MSGPIGAGCASLAPGTSDEDRSLKLAVHIECDNVAIDWDGSDKVRAVLQVEQTHQVLTLG